jgi:hypothetical protein
MRKMFGVEDKNDSIVRNKSELWIIYINIYIELRCERDCPLSTTCLCSEQQILQLVKRPFYLQESNKEKQG